VPVGINFPARSISLRRWHQIRLWTLKQQVNYPEVNAMKVVTIKVLAIVAAGMLVAGTSAFAQQSSAARGEVMNSVPANSRTVTDWYKQNVYDPKEQKIGQIKDVLVGQNGQIEAAIVGVGGFLGAGGKDVAVSFNSIKATKKNDKTYLTLRTPRDLNTIDKAPRGFPMTAPAKQKAQAGSASKLQTPAP
jgi:sporulation protein YlmC with PRC-barrel domain